MHSSKSDSYEFDRKVAYLTLQTKDKQHIYIDNLLFSEFTELQAKPDVETLSLVFSFAMPPLNSFQGPELQVGENMPLSIFMALEDKK